MKNKKHVRVQLLTGFAKIKFLSCPNWKVLLFCRFSTVQRHIFPLRKLFQLRIVFLSLLKQIGWSFVLVYYSSPQTDPYIKTFRYRYIGPMLVLIA